MYDEKCEELELQVAINKNVVLGLRRNIRKCQKLAYLFDSEKSKQTILKTIEYYQQDIVWLKSNIKQIRKEIKKLK